MMRSWQQRLADCTFGGFTPQKDTSASRFTIGVRDRGKEQPRHITNLPEVLRKLAKRYPDAIVEPMSPVGMNLQAQAKVGTPCHRTRALSGPGLQRAAPLCGMGQGQSAVFGVWCCFSPEGELWSGHAEVEKEQHSLAAGAVSCTRAVMRGCSA